MYFKLINLIFKQFAEDGKIDEEDKPGMLRSRYSVSNRPAPMINNLNFTEESLDGVKSIRRNSQTSTYIRA